MNSVTTILPMVLSFAFVMDSLPGRRAGVGEIDKSPKSLSPRLLGHDPSMEELSSEEVFRNRFIGVSHKRFRRADGDEVERDVVEHPGSVAILAHDRAGVYLVSQPREAVGDDALLEIPAGTLDVPGE